MRLLHEEAYRVWRIGETSSSTRVPAIATGMTGRRGGPGGQGVGGGGGGGGGVAPKANHWIELACENSEIIFGL